MESIPAMHGKQTASTHRRAALAIVGIYPPPYGGVAVHLLRLVPHLDAAGIDYVFYNTGPTRTDHPRIRDVGWSWRWMLAMLFRSRHRVIQFNTSRWWVRIFASLINLLRGAQIIIYAHGYSLPDSFFKSGLIKRWLVQRSMRRVACVLACNPALRERILQMGFLPECVHVVPAFIPPEGAPSADKTPQAVRNFCAAHSPLLTANGAFVTVHGNDVYGLHAMADLVETLLPEHPQLGMVVYLRANADGDRGYYADLLKRIERSPLSEHVLFYESRGDFYPVLALTDVFLRPTTTDGDALSVREALAAGVPVVASDVIPRPEGCRLYPGGDAAGLHQSVADVLADLPGEKKQVAGLPATSAVERLLPIYRALLDEDEDHAASRPNPLEVKP